MKSWLESTVKRILKLSPKRVLEIGCGTGLLLSRIAPSTKLYHATDISQQAIDYIENSLKISPISHGVLNLTCRPAHIVRMDEKECYDLVIINSVVQYFSDVDYLHYVLSQALDSLEPGGHIFIGDVRSLPHLNLFHALTLLSKEFSKEADISLRQAIAKKHTQEVELLLDADFFRQFANQHKARIFSVRIEIKSSPFFDEMTTFRYDVLLSTSDDKKITSQNQPIQWLNWKDVQNLEKIEYLLEESSRGYLAVKEIPNQRLYDLNNFVNQSIDSSLEVNYVEWKKKSQFLEGINPADLYQIGNKIGYEVYASWSTIDSLSYFDLIFYQKELRFILDSYLHQELADNKDYKCVLNNNPLSLEDKKELNELLKQYLEYCLPRNMHPQVILYIDSIPLAQDGKVDFLSLPKDKIKSTFSKKSNNFDLVEKKLVDIWKKFLSLKNISLEDDFFDLGGHSLIAIQMLHDVEKKFSVNIPIHKLFGASTLYTFANIIRSHLLDKEMQLTGIEYKQHKQSPIVALSSKGNKTPCFFFHPVGGTVFPYIPLVKELNPDRPYYAIQNPGIYAKEPLFKSIEDMVSDYIKHICAIQPHGPYLLAGASMGGTLALEAAAQLADQGHSIEMIAMFDSWALFPEELSDKKRLEQGMMRQYEMTQLKLDKMLIPNPTVLLDVNYNCLQLLLNYKPRKLNKKVILFKCQELFEEFIPIDCPDNYWSQFALKGVDVYKVTGNHETMMIEPHVQQIAIILNRLLAEKEQQGHSEPVVQDNDA